jgi:dUTP pyrophosphatase
MQNKTAKSEMDIKIQQHLQELRQQAFRIAVQVLKPGDTYTIKTAEGEKTITIDVAGQLPSKKNITDAGFDLFTPYEVVLQPGEVKKVPLNIRMQLPGGSWGRIETKSGLGSQGHLVYAGVIDQDYRGVPHVIMTNLNRLGDKPIVIGAGEKIAQMTMNPHNLEFFVEQVEKVDTDTARGEGGFGSTGKK